MADPCPTCTHLRAALSRADDPDPNGCSHCGLASCRRGHWNATFEAMRGHVNQQSTPEAKTAFFEAYRQRMLATEECESRPTVDWQAVYREALSRAESQRDQWIAAARRGGEGIAARLEAAEARLAMATRFDVGDGITIKGFVDGPWRVVREGSERLGVDGQWHATPDADAIGYRGDDAVWEPWDQAFYPTADAAFAALATHRQRKPEEESK